MPLDRERAERLIPAEGDTLRPLGESVNAHQLPQTAPPAPEPPEIGGSLGDMAPSDNSVVQFIEEIFTTIDREFPELFRETCDAFSGAAGTLTNLSRTVATANLPNTGPFVLLQFAAILQSSAVTITTIEYGVNLAMGSLSGVIAFAWDPVEERGAIGLFLEPGVSFVNPGEFRDSNRLLDPQEYRRAINRIVAGQEILVGHNFTTASLNQLLDSGALSVSAATIGFRGFFSQAGRIQLSEGVNNEVEWVFGQGLQLGGRGPSFGQQIGLFEACPLPAENPAPNDPPLPPEDDFPPEDPLPTLPGPFSPMRPCDFTPEGCGGHIP